MEPELCFAEYKTQRKLISILHTLGIKATPIADTGVIATIQGHAPGPCIAIRSDMDALEVTEETTQRNQGYISRNKGIMHACGHDGHMAMVLGAARLLQEKRESFRGRVRLIFQPAEEQPPGGAIKVIEDGGLDGVDAILGLHIFTSIESGAVAFRPGSLMASSNLFTIKIKGKGGHHSAPGNCIDPILMASDFIGAVKNRSAMACGSDGAQGEQINGQARCFVIGFGKIEGGAQFNRTPDEVTILGSFRTFDDGDVDFVEDMMKQVLDELMETYSTKNHAGAPSYELEVLHGYPVLVNDTAFTQTAYSALKDRFCNLIIDADTEQIFGAEDFAYYLQKVPGIYFFLGNRNNAKGIVEGNHSNKFDIDEDILITGTEMLESIALDFLKRPEDYLSKGDSLL